MSEPTISVKSPGKLILLGEYAVLEGAPALVSSVNRYCTVTIKSLYNSTFQIRTNNLSLPEIQFTLDGDGNVHFASEVNKRYAHKLRFVFSILIYISKIAGKIPGAQITIDTTPFYHKSTGYKFGLGSSSALTTSLIAALFEYLGKYFDAEYIAELAYKVHHSVQDSKGSGIDIAASVHGGLLSYIKDADDKTIGKFKPLFWPEDLHMATIWSGYSSSTHNYLTQLYKFKKENEAKYNNLMKLMAQVSAVGVEAFGNNEIDTFLNVVENYLEYERELGRSSKIEILSEIHEEIAAIVKKLGGAYKPSGAGGGDIGVAFTNSFDTLQKIEHEIKQSIFDLLDVDVSHEGVALTMAEKSNKV